MTEHTHVVISEFDRYEPTNGSIVGHWVTYKVGVKVTPTKTELSNLSTCFRPIAEPKNIFSLQINISKFEMNSPELYGVDQRSNSNDHLRFYREVCEVTLEDRELHIGKEVVTLYQAAGRKPRSDWAWGLLNHSLKSAYPTPIQFRLRMDGRDHLTFYGHPCTVTAGVIQIIIHEQAPSESFVSLLKESEEGMNVLVEIGEYLGGPNGFEDAVKLALVLPPKELLRMWLLSQNITADVDIFRQMLNDILSYKPVPKEEWHVAGGLNHMKHGDIPDTQVPLWADKAEWVMKQGDRGWIKPLDNDSIETAVGKAIGDALRKIEETEDAEIY